MQRENSNDESTKVLRRTVIKMTAAGGVLAAAGGQASAGTAQDEEDEQEDGATIVFPEQTTDGTSIQVESATLPEGGFVSLQDPTAVHEPTPENRNEDGTMPWSTESFFERTVRGHTEYLESGTHEDFEIELEQPLEATKFYWVMVHGDSNGNESFDFVESGGDEDDGILTLGQNRLVGDAYLTVERSDDGSERDGGEEGNQSEDNGQDDENDGNEEDNETEGEDSSDGDDGGNESDGGDDSIPGFGVGAGVAGLGAGAAAAAKRLADRDDEGETEDE